LRICDVTMFWSASGGGVRRYIETKRAWLHRAHPGIAHSLVVPGAGGSLTTDGLDSTVTVRSHTIPFAPGYRIPLGRRGVAAAIEGLAPDFLECGCPFVMRRAASEWRRRSGRPVFDYYHAYFPLNYTAVMRGRHPVLAGAVESRGWGWLRRAYSDSTRIFLASPSVRRRLAAEGIVNTELAPLGVDLEMFRPPGAGRAEPAVLLFAGRLTEEKGLSDVLACYGMLRGSFDVSLVVVGDGLLRPKVEKAASRDARIRYAGYLPPGELAREYGAATVLVSGAPAETLGLTFLEALACGTPVVGISGSGLIDVLPSGVVRAVPRRDPGMLAEAVAGVLGAPPDPAECRAAAMDYGWDTRLEHILRREIELSGIGEG
jgi:alpha-1,6-mannosyltransferase